MENNVFIVDDIIAYAEGSIQSSYLETDCITPIILLLLGADCIENTASSTAA
jgi:hypothetical protein